MHQIHLNDQLYQQALGRAKEAGSSSVDEYVADVISNDLELSIENHDHLFTPEVIGELDRVATSVNAGGKIYSSEDVKEHFRKRSEAWRANRTSH